MTAPTTPSAETGSAYKWWVLAAVGIGSFMVGLDGSVVNTVLPVIRDALGSDVPTVEWAITIYLLVVTGLLLSLGRLGDLRGHKQIYITGMAVFTLGSALCGAAPGVGALIAARALQAVGGAMLFANSSAIVTKTFPSSQRGQALGLGATLVYLGLMTGPSLGGWLASQWSWRAIFFVNVPLGLASLVVSFRVLPRHAPERDAERFDLAGAATFTGGLVALLVALNQGHAWGWASPRVIGLLAASAVLLALFLTLERRAKSPMLDLGLFHNRLFTASTASATLNYICVSAVLFLLPFYLIQGRGLSPVSAGLLLTSQPLLMAITAPLAGSLSDRIGARLPATAGMVLIALGLLLLSRLGTDTPLAQVGIDLAVVGLGTGLFTSPNNSALMGSAPRYRQGIAAGVMATARNFGMVLGVGLAGAVLATVMASGQGGGTGLFRGISTSFLLLAGVAGLGALASAVREG